MTRPDDYEVKNPAVQAALLEIAHGVKAKTPAGMGFAVFLFDYGANGALFYMASANRDDMVQMLREWLAREGVATISGRGDRTDG